MRFLDSIRAVGLGVAVYLGVAALYLPDPEPPPYYYRPLCEPVAASESKSCTKDTECPKNQVCVQGTCGMAACAPEHGTTVAGVTGETWSLN